MSEADFLPAAPVAEVERPLRRLLRAYAESRIAVFGLALLLVIVLAALFAPWLAPQNPYDLMQLDMLDGRLPPGSASGDGRLTYLLGTDEQGRDMLSAILYGLRISVGVGVVATLLALAIGLALGLAAGYFGGRFDSILMRIADIQLSFPSILVAMILLALFGQGIDKIVIALVAAQWAYYARTTRSAALVEGRKEYIEAARLLGLSTPRILFRHLLPNCLPPLIVVAALQVAAAIALEATLSFLGIGLQPPAISWGIAISDASGLGLLRSAPHMLLFPSLFLSLTVLAFIMLGDVVRDALDPKNR